MPITFRDCLGARPYNRVSFNLKPPLEKTMNAKQEEKTVNGTADAPVVFAAEAASFGVAQPATQTTNARGPATDSYAVAVRVLKISFEDWNLGRGAALGLVITLINFLMSAVYVKALRRH